MKDVIKKALNKGIGAFGDMMDETICLLVLYQPKSYKRGQRENDVTKEKECKEK